MFLYSYFQDSPPWMQLLHQILPLWYWTRNWQMCINLFTLFPGDYDNLLQWPFSKNIHLGICNQLDPLSTWRKTIRPYQDPAYKKPTISTKTRVTIILISNFIPHSKLFSETEGFLIDVAGFMEIDFSDPPVSNAHTQTSLFFAFP